MLASLLLGFPAVAGVTAVLAFMKLLAFLMLLGPAIVDVPSVPRVSTMLASLLLGFPCCGWRHCCFSLHEVVGISVIVGVLLLLTSLQKKKSNY
jgi:hypothetical protein